MGKQTFGHGDPNLDEALVKLHDEAEQSGQALYLDPQLGLWVQTRATLAEKQNCCGNGCRHCPYDRQEQRAAGRAVLRP